MAPNESAQDPKPDSISKIKEEFFYDILEKKYGNYKIREFHAEKCSIAGENFLAMIFRVNIEVETADGKVDVVDWIVKVMPPKSSQQEFIIKMRPFDKEVEMYEKIIPQFEEIFREHGESIQFAPKCWKTMQDPELLIMDDLKVGNYENIDRLHGMDMAHTKATLSKVAKFHAASACIYEKNGPFSDQLMAGLYNDELRPSLEAMQPIFWSVICEHIKQWNTCQEFVSKIVAFKDRVVDLSKNAYEVDPNDFNVLTHGDLWSNNIMFQHGSSGEIKDVCLVDLQISKWGSPVQDLLYLIISSTENAIKIKEFDYMIHFYHSELVKNLKFLEYGKDMPRLVDLHIQLLKQGFIGIMVCFGVMTVALLDPSENSNMENFFGEDEAGKKFKNYVYSNPRFIKACSIVFPFLENRGVLDM